MIPKSLSKYADRIESYENANKDWKDGYWVTLKPGWTNDAGGRLLHEYTLRELRAALKNAEQEAKP